MIFRENLFSGALGKLWNIGTPKNWATPHTVKIEPDNTFEVPFNIQGDLEAHSLDGRLWFYRRSKRLGIIALKWNSETAKLEYAEARNLSNNSEVVLACGLDWILTNNTIFMVADEAPFIRSAALFDADIPFFFLYSLLRDQRLGESGIDPITGEAWGLHQDNGNSDGNGYFMKNTHLLYPAGSHVFEACYSLLPAVGDWQIFENFLIQRPNASETIKSYNYMHAVRPLIPLEFNNDETALYGTGYNFDHRGIQLFHCNGQIWGKGLQSIGKVSLLPAVFGDKDSVQEYYLCIQPDFTFYPHSDFFFCNISYFDLKSGEKITSEELSHDNSEDGNAEEDFLVHSFAVSVISRTWAQAKAACKVLGGHLATSTSEVKNSFLASLIGGKTVWLGGSDEVKEGTWQWITGEDWDYTNWASGEPNNSKNEDFLALQPSGTWNNAGASASHYYICEWDYVIDENDFLGCLWPDLSPVSLGSDSLYCVLSEQANTLINKPCVLSSDARIFRPQTGDFTSLSDNNGQSFFDVLSYKGLWLDDNGAQILLGESVDDPQVWECKTLPQWLAPAESIYAVTEDYVAASADKALFLTSLKTGFNRQFIFPNTMPLSARSFAADSLREPQQGTSETQQDSSQEFYRLAISETSNESNRKVFSVCRLLDHDITPQTIEWQDIYKEAVKITFLNLFEVPFHYEEFGFPFNFNAALNDTPVFRVSAAFYVRYKKHDTQVVNVYQWLYGGGERYEEVLGDAYFDTPEEDSGIYSNRIQYSSVEKIIDRVDFEILVIDPDNGEKTIHSVSFHIPNNVVMETIDTTGRIPSGDGAGIIPYPLSYLDVSEESTLYTNIEIVLHDNNVCVSAVDFFQGSQVFFPALNLPDNVQRFIAPEVQSSIIYKRMFNEDFKYFEGRPVFVDINMPNKTFIAFAEQFSKTLFGFELSSIENWQQILTQLIPSIVSQCYTCPCNYDTVDNSSGTFSKTALLIFEVHWLAVYGGDEHMHYFVFRADTYPEVFDFYAHSERRNLL